MLGDKRVAVKVQHPNLTERLDIDMEVLRWIANWSGDRVKETVDQFACNFQAQLDFRDEARNLNTFNERFSGYFWNGLVSFPRPIEGLISEHVLVETYETGESVAHFLGRVVDGDNDSSKENSVESGASNNSSNNSEFNKLAENEIKKEESNSSVFTTQLTEAQKDVLIRKQVAQCGMQAFLKMLIWDNFIHADLHPGNGELRVWIVGRGEERY
jgi:predicted unusual protein kinase regulating ubiquinone biosynthesis (AarF/ABC1/UbiB family)